MSTPDQPHTGSVQDTLRLIGRAIAVFTVVMLLQALPPMQVQSGALAGWWTLLFLPAFLTGLLLLTVTSIRGPRVRGAGAVLAVVVLAGLLLWPTAMPPAVAEDLGTPWLWGMVTGATACCALAANVRVACGYAVVIGAVFAVVRYSPSGGSAGLTIALQDALFATVLGVVVVLTIGILLDAAASADRAAGEAVRNYRHAAERQAMLNERHRLDAMLHDTVMTALITAAQAESAPDRQPARALPRWRWPNWTPRSYPAVKLIP